MTTQRDAHALTYLRESIADRTDAAVVVGVDGSEKSFAAVRWAVDEAAGRNLRLRIVCAIDRAAAATALPPAMSRAREAAHAFLAEATTQARLRRPEVVVDAAVVDGRPAEVLVQSDHPAMICVGTSAPATPHPGHHVSTVTELIVSADCPVTLFHGESPNRGWVVAEIGAEPQADDILRMAVEESLLRGLPVRLLEGTHGCGTDTGLSRSELRERIERSLDRWQRRCPELDGALVSELWTVGQFLDRYTRNIALFIAPPRQVHAVGTILHPTAATALELLQCPVMLFGASTDGTP